MEANSNYQQQLGIAIYQRNIKMVQEILKITSPCDEILNDITTRTLKDRTYMKILDLLLEDSIPTTQMIQQADRFSNSELLQKFALKQNGIENQIRLCFYLKKERELFEAFRKHPLTEELFNEFQIHTRFNPCSENIFNIIKNIRA